MTPVILQNNLTNACREKVLQSDLATRFLSSLERHALRREREDNQLQPWHKFS